MKVEIDDTELPSLGPAARNEFRKHTEEFAATMLAEANRLEDAQRTAAGSAEITSTHVNDAATLIRRHYIKPRRSRWRLALSILLYVGAAVAGVGGNHLDETWGVVLFAVSLSLAVGAIAILEILP